MVKHILVAILVGVALSLGYAIYTQKSPTDPVTASPTPPASIVKSPDVLPDELGDVPYPKGSDEYFLLTIASTATEADKRRHYLLAVRMAQEAESLKINNCVATPLVFRVKNNAMMKIVNEDSVSHTLSFNEKLKIVVPAKSTKEIKATFGSGPALYGYGCDQGLHGAGLILVIP